MQRVGKTTASLSAAFLSGLAMLAVSPLAAAHTRITTDVTWSEHIREILRNKCMVCHHPGGLAPDYVDLTVYGTDTNPGARAWAVAIEEEILTGRMPPWKADERFGHFSNSKALTEEEVDLIIAWVRGGAPQGPKQNLPPPEEFVERAWEFGEPDLVVELPEPHVLPANELRATASATVALDVEEDRWITGYEFWPDKQRDIYSITAYIHDPEGYEPAPIEVEMETEYDPLASEEELEQKRLREMPKGPHFLGQWVRGEKPVLLPEAGGRLLRAGSSIELSVVYERPVYADWSEEVTDQSKLGLFLAAPEEEIDLLVESTMVANTDFVIPAGESDVRATAELVFEESVNIIGLHPHLGALGKKLSVLVHYPDGLAKTLLWVPEHKKLFASSFQFAEPIKAPKGTRLEFIAHYDNTENNWDNPNSPPVDVKAGDSPGDETLLAWVDYALADHLIIEQPIDPALLVQAEANRGGGMDFAATVVAGIPPFAGEPDKAETPAPPALAIEDLLEKGGAADENIWWCPMRGNPCRIMDYHAPGECEDCWMELKPKSFFFEGKDIAPRTTEWTLTKIGKTPIYWCPNRGLENHTPIDYYSEGTCPICGEPLIHQARFETKRTYTCLTPDCPLLKTTFYGPGLCPACGQPVSGMGHMDHTPVHGGWQFFMADNLYHHLEGTMPEQGEFRLYFYDDWKEPLDPRNFAGKLVFEHVDATSGEVTEEIIPLEYETDGHEWLTARIPYDLPVTFYANVWLAGEEKRFDFMFDELTTPPDPEAEPVDFRLHTHIREPVVIPPTVEGIVKEILTRDETLKLLIQAEDWYGLHYPAFDAKDFAAALAEPARQEGLNVRQRGTLRQAIGYINRGALALDRAGDVADVARVTNAYAEFEEGVKLLKQIWPSVAP